MELRIRPQRKYSIALLFVATIVVLLSFSEAGAYLWCLAVPVVVFALICLLPVLVVSADDATVFVRGYSPLGTRRLLSEFHCVRVVLRKSQPVRYIVEFYSNTRNASLQLFEVEAYDEAIHQAAIISRYLKWPVYDVARGQLIVRRPSSPQGPLDTSTRRVTDEDLLTIRCSPNVLNRTIAAAMFCSGVIVGMIGSTNVLGNLQLSIALSLFAGAVLAAAGIRFFIANIGGITIDRVNRTVTSWALSPKSDWFCKSVSLDGYESISFGGEVGSNVWGVRVTRYTIRLDGARSPVAIWSAEDKQRCLAIAHQIAVFVEMPVRDLTVSTVDSNGATDE